ncbi:GerAB/ArcD/ProY family transporter [Desulfosporosinus nitroreducens]|uniref:Endospore germination permease n=1 Tax=Desulfosporosinus nitroreducens TaxID=2018668 RepID=A0ABT8QTD0_9FIRM|nr:endospore germination permease [Desulfosporosinus nitroreducens]MDO0824621.1 endospore germination permease [Desulfosporosinus nitroreducens]
MLEKGIINTKQFIWLLYIIISSFVAMQIPSIMIMQAGRDAWLSVLGAWFLDVMLALVYAYMGIRFPGENFVQYSITILGKYLGRMVGILFPLFFLLAGTLVLQGLSQIVSTVFLPTTPFQVILIASYFVSALIGRKGIEVVARMTEVLGPLFFISIIILCFLVLPSFEIDRLKPQFDQGVSQFLVGAPLLLTSFGVCIIMSMYIPLCNRPENGFLAKFIAVSLGALAVGLITTLSVGIFGIEDAQYMYTAGLELAKMINFSNYLERVEMVWLLILVGSTIVASSSLFWAFGQGIAQIVGLKTYQPLIYSGALLSLVLCITSFPRSPQQTHFYHYTFPIVAVFVEAGLEIFLFIAALILGKRGTA